MIVEPRYIQKYGYFKLSSKSIGYGRLIPDYVRCVYIYDTHSKSYYNIGDTVISDKPPGVEFECVNNSTAMDERQKRILEFLNNETNIYQHALREYIIS